MDKTMQAFQNRRRNVLLFYVAYFALLLVAGALIFLVGLPSAAAAALVAVCIVFYLAAVRPYGKKYTAALRETTLREIVCAGMEDFHYEPKQGVSADLVWKSGLIASSNASTFLSREHITGRIKDVEAELSDVTFPIRENNLNAMFNGCFIRLTYPGASFEPLTVKRGDLKEVTLSGSRMRQLEELGKLIPGSLYLHMEGECLEVLLRARFVSFQLNPLMPVSESNPLPEFLQAVQFGQLCRK